MDILVICQYYYPEPFRINQICEALVARGNKVTVVTGVPNYPKGYIYEGYRHGAHRDEEINGVRVHRCFTIGRRTGAFWRMLNYFSFMLSSVLYTSRMREKYDVVFVNQLSPVTMACAGIHYKKKHHKNLILYCLDLWPENLTAGGIRKDSAVFKLFHRISHKIYKQADEILISSQSFAQYFEEEFGIHHTTYIPQYAERVFTPDACRKMPGDTVDLMFAGNVGVEQSVDTIIRAAALCRDIPNLRWHIVGDGSELERCKVLAREMKAESVIFHGRRPVEEMPGYYAMADTMLITMKRNSVGSMTLPGKMQSYLAAGKPVIVCADGEASRLVAEVGCGLCCEAESPEQLAGCVRKFIGSGEVRSYSDNAIACYQKYFAEEIFFEKIEQCMEKYHENSSK